MTRAETDAMEVDQTLKAVQEDRRVKTVVSEAEALAEIEKEKRGRGRPTEYQSVLAGLAEKFTLMGATDLELAGLLGISERTLNTWKRRHPEFLQSIKRGKANADANVVKALYHRATGYEATEITTTDARGRITTHTRVLKHYPPDTAAAIFWLKNRQRKHWRDHREYAVANLVRDMTDRDIDALVNKMKKRFIAKRKRTISTAEKRSPRQIAATRSALPRMVRPRLVGVGEVRRTSRARRSRRRARR